MGKFIIYLLSFFLSFEIGSAQSDSVRFIAPYYPEILKTEKYNEGVYKNIFEFLSNSPSIKRNFELQENVLKFVDPKSGRKKFFNDTHWGVSIKNDVYLKYKEFYMILRLKGEYCVFSCNDYYFDTGIFTSLLANGPDIILNVMTGEMMPLNVFYLKKILKDKNPYLYNKFEEENEKESEMIRYLKALNENLKSN